MCFSSVPSFTISISMTRRLTLFFACLLLRIICLAQVTTSSITGTVKAQGGQGLAGATVAVLHLPTGTNYSVLSGSSGAFTLPNLLPGGPYRLLITYSGYDAFRLDSITLLLGQPFTWMR